MPFYIGLCILGATHPLQHQGTPPVSFSWVRCSGMHSVHLPLHPAHLLRKIPNRTGQSHASHFLVLWSSHPQLPHHPWFGQETSKQSHRRCTSWKAAGRWKKTAGVGVAGWDSWDNEEHERTYILRGDIHAEISRCAVSLGPTTIDTISNGLRVSQPWTNKLSFFVFALNSVWSVNHTWTI